MRNSSQLSSSVRIALYFTSSNIETEHLLPNNSTKRTTLDRESKEHTRRLRKSLNKVRLSQALMQIFWTAGPVTSLGLIGGYYIGYGTMPSTALLIYFISFTAIAGIIGLVAKVIYTTTQVAVEEQGERDILDVTDKLGDLILSSRDWIVQSYEGRPRDIEAAMQLLRRLDMTPYGVRIAFTDLTDSREIGEMMGRLFTYRRIGLFSKADQLAGKYRGEIESLIEEVGGFSLNAAEELKGWFYGRSMESLKFGVEREAGFLQRIMSAIEYNNPLLMTLRDAEEMLILAFELISEREIPTLIFSYKGSWKYANILDEYQKRRSRFRVAQAKSGNRIRALAAYLTENQISDPDFLQEDLPIEDLLQRVVRSLDSLSGLLVKEMTKDAPSRSELIRLEGILESAEELYKLAFKGSVETKKAYSNLLDISKKWEAFTEKSNTNTKMFEISNQRKGITIRENEIFLNEEARLEVCRHLAWYLKKEMKTNERAGIVSNKSSAMKLRRVAIELALALEPHIQMSKPEIQRNINATKAIYLGGLTPDMSAAQKAELGKRMAEIVDNSPKQSAAHLADTLVRYYGVNLSADAKEFLIYNYDVDPAYLDELRYDENQSWEEWFGELYDPVDIPPPKSRWSRIRQNARKLR